jgi:acyl-CoA dehydrogenase
LAGATTYLRLFALTAGMAYLAEAALMTLKLGLAPEQYKADERIAIARFFAEHIGSACSGLSSIVVLGSDAVMLGRKDVFG